MKLSGVFTVTLGLMLLGSSAAYAQAQMPNQQLAEQWVRCRQGQASTAGDCSAIQSEFNRRASEVRSRDARIQRGESVPETARPAPAATTPTPAAAPAAPSTPTARPAPLRNAPNLSGSEVEDNCVDRQVIPMPGGYMCL